MTNQLSRKLQRIGAGSAVTVALVISLLALRPESSGARQTETEAGPPRPEPRDSVLWMQMQNVDMRVDAHNNFMRIRSLRGRVEPTTAGAVA